MGERPMNRQYYLRWAGFVSGVWMMNFIGFSTFGLYSSDLKSTLGISQVQLNALPTGMDLSVLGAVLSDYVPCRSLLILGAVMGFLGYGTLWLTVSKTIAPLPFWMEFIACVMGGCSYTFKCIAVFSVFLRNFPGNRGPVSGLFSANIALSAAIYSIFLDFLFGSSSSSVLLMLTLVSGALMLLSAFLFHNILPPLTFETAEEDAQNILIFNLISFSLAIFLLIGELWTVVASNTTYRKVFVAILVILILSPASVLLKRVVLNCKREGFSKNSPSESHSGLKGYGASLAISPDALDINRVVVARDTHDPKVPEIWKEPLLTDVGWKDGSGFSVGRVGHPRSKKRGSSGNLPELGDDHSTTQLLRSWEFYMLYFALLCASGSGTAFIDNISQVVQSFGFSTVATLSSWFSISNFAGRILSGILSEYLLRKMAVPRSFWMALAKLAMATTLFWMATTGSATTLYAGSIVLGFGLGVHMNLTIPILCEFYGLKAFGTSYSICMSVLPLGSFLFSVLLTGILYDWEAFKQHEAQAYDSRGLSGGSRRSALRSESLTCDGVVCYKIAFMIMGGLLSVGSGLDMAIVSRSRRLSKTLQWKLIEGMDVTGAGM